MNNHSNILSVKELRISFGEFKAVDNISFSIDKGKTLAIVGESGSGKSMTALSLMGLLPKGSTCAGDIVLCANNQNWQLNSNTPAKTWQQLRGKEMGMVFQEPMSSLNPVMSIGNQLAEVINEHQQVGKKAAKKIAVEWLGKVQLPTPENIYNRFPHQLSGGQKQRVMIAMAMCNKPALLIADEPTTALDVTVQKDIITLMKQLQQEHDTAMIFITHDLALASNIANNIMVMYKGEVVEYGKTIEVLETPKHKYTQALLACKPNVENKGKRLPVIGDFLGGEALPREVYHVNVTTDKILQVNNLKVWFTENTDWVGRPVSYFKAVDNVSFDLKRGEVLGLVGESGCGKSTISKSLMGLLPVREGQILFNNKDLATLSHQEWNKARCEIQLIFQDPYASLNPRMTIGDMLIEPMLTHNIVARTELKNEAKRLLDLVHLPADSMKRYPHQFSGGQRQRIGIARSLALRPKLLICDESVSALDVSVQAQILNLLKELQQEFNLTYLFISHDLNVVNYISDRVMVMQAGHIVEVGEATQVLQQPQNDYTKRLVAAMP